MTPLLRLTTIPTPSLSDRLRAEPVDTINHELRTPLTALLGHAELLRDLDLPEAAERSLDAIIGAGERLVSLAIAFSRIADLERATNHAAPGKVGPFSVARRGGAGRRHG